MCHVSMNTVLSLLEILYKNIWWAYNDAAEWIGFVILCKHSAIQLLGIDE